MSKMYSMGHSLNLDEIWRHLFDHSYMSGVERNDIRVKTTGEIFTPTELVNEILDRLDPSLFSDPNKTFLDPSCGDGQFLASILWRKVQNGIQFKQALSTIYGVDIMADNVKLCRNRLLCGYSDSTITAIVENNIVVGNAVTSLCDQIELPLC